MKGLLIYSTIIILFVLMFTTSCSSGTQVSREELEQIVQRDGVPFDHPLMPDEVLDRLESYRVVLVGETHFLREHRELVVKLLSELHARGFRQFLFEWTQVADWLLADFVGDEGLKPDWAPPLSIGGDMLTSIRDFNRTLPEDQRIQVHAIDVNLDDYGGSQSFLNSLGALVPYLPSQGPLSVFLQSDYKKSENQKALLETLLADLNTNQLDLIVSWGEKWYNTIVETVEVELASVPIRSIRDSDYDKSVRLREDAIKRLVDSRLQDCPQGTLINIGATHAQKERLWGNKIEWLGDYLVHRSPVVEGSVIVLDVSAAYIIPVQGSGMPDYDLKASPENELFRVMNRTWPEQIVFLPLDDLVFSSNRVPINIDGEIFKGALKRQFDAIILLPLANRVPSTS